jgi:RNA polymerase sigma factor (sigma-70 family)
LPLDNLKARRFEQLVMPHLNSACNLARGLTHNRDDAQDVLQEACLRAYKYLDTFDGQSARSWLLKIVRNTYFTWVQTNHSGLRAPSLEADIEFLDSHATAINANAQVLDRSPETIIAAAREKQRLGQLISRLPSAYRDIILLRLNKKMSYRDIATAVGIPIGTVTSRLARARQLLERSWAEAEPKTLNGSSVASCSRHRSTMLRKR